MTAVPGLDLASSNDLSPSQVVGILAMALRRLHQVPIAECPFDHRLEERIAAAKNRVSVGLVDEADFDNERLGRTATDVLAELLATLPETYDLVVTHGDACLPNFMAEGSNSRVPSSCSPFSRSRFDDREHQSTSRRSAPVRLGATALLVFAPRTAGTGTVALHLGGLHG